jgi:hypothetical protein
MSSAQNMLVTGSNTVLFVTGDFSLSGQASVTLQPGASLALYIGGGNGSIGGAGINNPGSPGHFRYLGLPTHTNVVIATNLNFNGVLYAPNAAVNVSSATTTTNHIAGSVVAQTIRAAGRVLFHYDEALQRLQ